MTFQVAVYVPVARLAKQEPHLEAEVQRAALRQLLAGGPCAESLHILLVLIVAALVWDSLPLEVTTSWMGGVIVTALLRTLWRLGVPRRSPSPRDDVGGPPVPLAGERLAMAGWAAHPLPRPPPPRSA